MEDEGSTRSPEGEDIPVAPLALPQQGERYSRGRAAPRCGRPFLVRSPGIASGLRGINLSTGGLMCHAEEPLWPGNVLELEILLSTNDATPIRARGPENPQGPPPGV